MEEAGPVDVTSRARNSRVSRLEGPSVFRSQFDRTGDLSRRIRKGDIFGKEIVHCRVSEFTVEPATSNTRESTEENRVARDRAIIRATSSRLVPSHLVSSPRISASDLISMTKYRERREIYSGISR